MSNTKDPTAAAIKKLHMLIMPVPSPEVTPLEICKVVSERAREIIELLQSPAPQPPGDLNLQCKSTQKRLATLWGFVPAAPQPPGDAREACGYEACDCRNYCKKQAATAQASEPSAEDDKYTIDRAADLLEHYAQFINRVKPEEIEEHPYLPEIELTAADLRKIAPTAAAPSKANAPSAPMSDGNRLVAFSAAMTLRSIGYEWDDAAERWQAAPARAVEPLTGKEIHEAMSSIPKWQWATMYAPQAGSLANAAIDAFCKKNGITTTPAAKAGKDGGV